MPDDLQQQLQQHARCVRSLAAAMLGDPDAADDVVQETLLVAGRQQSLRVRSLRAWVLKIGRHLAGQRLRSERRRARREQQSYERSDRPAPAAADEVERSEQLRAIADAVAALPPLLRDAVMLRHFDELPPRQIAERLGISVEAVESRLRRGHEQLRRELRRFAPGGDVRGALLAFVVPVGGVAAAGRGTTVAVSGTIMTSKAKFVLGAALLLLVCGGVTVLVWRASGVGDAPEPVASQRAVHEDRGAMPPVIAREEVATTRSAAAELAAAGPRAGEREVSVHGRVVDVLRQAVPFAQVGVEVAGRAVLRGSADAAGRFTLQFDAAWNDAVRGVVFASDASRSGVIDFYDEATDRASTRELCVLLESAGGLLVRVQHGDAVVADADVRAVRGAMTAAGPSRRGRTDASGVVRFEGLPVGRHAIGAVAADGRQIVGHVDVLPGEAATVALDFAAATPVAIEVCSAVDGSAIADARIEGLFVFESNTTVHVPLGMLVDLPVTDERGRATLRCCRSPQRVAVSASHPDWSPSWPWTSGSVMWQDSGAAPVRIEKLPFDAVTWRLVAGEVAVPPDGTVFTIAGRPVVLEDGVLRVDRFSLGVIRAYAIGPGCYAELDPPEQQEPGAERTAAVQRSRRLTLQVHDLDGAPIAGCSMQTFSHGGSRSAVTDADGCAVFDGMVAETLRFTCCGDDGMRTTRTADLKHGDAELRLAFAPQRLRARVFVDGEPALPGRYAVRCGNWQVSQIVEHEAACELTITLLRDDAHAAATLYLDPAPVGMANALAKFTPRDECVDLHVGRSLGADVRVLRPADDFADLDLERFQDGAWQRCYRHVGTSAPRPLTDLKAGRYRLFDRSSGVAGEAVTIAPDTARAELWIDLSGVVPASGRVSAGHLDGVELEVRTRDGELVRRVPVAPDGRFRTRADLSRPLLLVAVRGDVRSAPADWTGPAAGLVLVLPE